MTAFTLPTREQEQELHRRLLARDTTAPSDLATIFHEALLQDLRHRNDPRLTDDFFDEAACQTWMSLCKNPSSFDGKGSLWHFLRMSAKCDLQNILAKERLHQRKFQTTENVEQWPAHGNNEEDHTDLAEAVRRDILPIVKKGLSEAELSFLELYLSGEKKTSAFAAALGIADRSKSEQETAVKQTKDKLKLRIKRARNKHGRSET